MGRPRKKPAAKPTEQRNARELHAAAKARIALDNLQTFERLRELTREPIADGKADGELEKNSNRRRRA